MLDFLRSSLPKSSLARGASVLLGGNAAGQVLLILTSPLLTRLYTPEEFGVLAVYASCLAILGSIVCLRYPQAIPFLKEKEDAATVALLGFVVLLFFVIVVSLLVVLFREFFLDVLGVPGLSPFLWMIPLGLLVLGVFQILSAWAVRDREYGDIARSKLWQAVSMTAIQLLGFKLGAAALLFGHTLGQGAGIFRLLRSALRTGLKSASQVTVGRVLELAFRMREYPLYSMPTSLASALGNQLPPLLLAAWFGPVIAGVYMLAYRVLMLPLQIIGQAIEDAFSSSARESREGGRLGDMLLKVASLLSGILMAPFMLGALLAPDMFALVFGAEWRDAGVFARWLFPFAFLALISAPLNKVYMVLEKQRVGLSFSVAALLLKTLGLALGAWYGSVIVAIALFSLTACLVRYLSFMWACTVLEKSGLNFSYKLLAEFLLSVLLTSPLWFALVLQSQKYFWWAAILSAVLVACRFFFGARRLYRI